MWEEEEKSLINPEWFNCTFMKCQWTRGKGESQLRLTRVSHFRSSPRSLSKLMALILDSTTSGSLIIAYAPLLCVWTTTRERIINFHLHFRLHHLEMQQFCVKTNESDDGNMESGNLDLCWSINRRTLFPFVHSVPPASGDRHFSLPPLGC